MFLRRTLPASSMPKPHCMKKTVTPAQISLVGGRAMSAVRRARARVGAARAPEGVGIAGREVDRRARGVGVAREHGGGGREVALKPSDAGLDGSHCVALVRGLLRAGVGNCGTEGGNKRKARVGGTECAQFLGGAGGRGGGVSENGARVGAIPAQRSRRSTWESCILLCACVRAVRLWTVRSKLVDVAKNK